MRQIAREGVWAGALVGAQQVVLGATLVVANRVEGGVVAAQLAYAFFLLPQALLAHPIYTSAFPVLATEAAAGRVEEFRRQLSRTGRRLGILLVLATAGLLLLARPLVGLVRFGAFDQSGVSLAVGGLRAYTLGLMGFGAYMLLCRAWAALGRTRVPGIVSLVTAATGVIVMFGLVGAVPVSRVVVVVGLAHSAIFTGAAVVLFVMLIRWTSASTVAAESAR